MPRLRNSACPPEQAMVFAIEDSPVNMVGGFDLVVNLVDAQPKVQEAFKNGGGIDWGDHGPCLFCAVARFFRPGYLNNLHPELVTGARRRSCQAARWCESG